MDATSRLSALASLAGRIVALLGLGLLIFGVGAQGAAAQDAGFPLGATTAYCEPGYLGPLVGCTPWEGVTVTFTSDDGEFNTTCVTQSPGGSDPRGAQCGVDVPFGATILASIDPASVPDGYVLEQGVTQEFMIPNEPPSGLFGGPVWVLLPADDSESAETPVDDASVAVLPATGSGRAGDWGDRSATQMTLLLLAGLGLALAASGVGGGQFGPTDQRNAGDGPARKTPSRAIRVPDDHRARHSQDGM